MHTSVPWCGLTEPQSFISAPLPVFARSYHKVGGPIDGETLKSWKAKLQKQLSVEGAAQREETAVRNTPQHEGGAEESAPARVAQQEERSERHDRSSNEDQGEGSLRVQIASFAGLVDFTRGDRANLEEMERLLAEQATGSSSLGAELSDTPEVKKKLRELNRIMTMIKFVEEMAVSDAL